MQALLALTMANIRSYTRDRAAVFWTLAFPLVFIVLFGLIFQGGGGSRLTLGWVDNDKSQAAAQLKVGFAALNGVTLAETTREDAAAAIPLYERAIAALESVDVEVPAVLYNNAGFQHMTVAGHFERGPDRDSYRRAQALFKKAVKVHPELHFGWANLGNLHRLQGEWAVAAICYGEALTTARQQGIAYPQGHNELAQVLVESGKAAEAEVAHRAAITLADSPSLRAKLRAEYARSLVLAGRIDDARASAEEGLAEHPDNTHCLALLADVDGDEGASA